ncbi:MAG: formate dehydrogenase subunit gamma [Anaerolineae bacterium]
MSHDYELTLAERKRLKEKKITKHYVANILTHWFNALSWALLLPTGLGILAAKRMPFMPVEWNNLMRNLFGGLAPLIQSHEIWGQIWLAVLIFNVFFGFRKFFVPFAATRMWLDKDDIEWLKKKPLEMLGFKVKLPPQDAYNGGQKIYSYVVIVGTVVIGITGMIMTYSEGIPDSLRWLVQWSMPLHFVAVTTVFAGVIIHVYMGAIMPEERQAFFSMFNGKVSALYAYLHHRKWYEQKMAEEREAEAEYVARRLLESGDTESEALLEELAASSSAGD